MSSSERILAGLRRGEEEGRLHHAYLLAGPETGAKMRLVQELAASFSTRSDAADRMARDAHPDFLVLRPENEVIAVDAVRALPKALAYPPMESRRRVVVVEDAGSLNGQAANAFLKVLEEPPGHTMFFLLCREPGELLPTVVSRCQVLRVAPLSDAELAAALGGDGPSAGAGTERIIALAEGSLRRAEALLRQEGGAERVQDAAERMLQLWEAAPRIPGAVFGWVEALEEAAVPTALDTWQVLLRDLAFVGAGAEPSALRFPAFAERLGQLAATGEVGEECAAGLAAINRFRVYRDFNGNLRLDLAALLAELQIFPAGKSRITR